MKANVVNVMELNDIPDDALGLLIESDADLRLRPASTFPMADPVISPS